MAFKTKSHVKRIYKLITNPDNEEEKEISTDVFIDVRRYDHLAVRFQSGEEEQLAQEIKYVFKWNDDKNNKLDNIDASKADKQFENANAKRKTKKRVIKDPEVKKADEEGELYLWLVERVKVYMPRGEEFERQNQLVQFVFNNKPKDESDGDPAKTRKTTVIKVPNNDLGGMKMRIETSDEDEVSSRIVDWDTYKEALQNGKEDKEDLSLNVEFTDSFIVRFSPQERGTEGQRIKHVLQSKLVEELYFKGDEEAKDADGETAVIRLDPLQTIVNVGTNIIAVQFLPGKK